MCGSQCVCYSYKTQHKPKIMFFLDFVC
uniref:Uncharacterized protein n=1 Tax=Anguilla anguilla TaxID=7936 RepID=A0A0E9V1J9_ANGAN